jgi:hypothetical protein
MSRGERVLVFVAIAMLTICGVLGVAPNVAAIYDYDNGIDYVTVTFNDTTAVNITDGGTYNTTANQTSITLFYIYSNFIYDAAPDTTYVEVWVVIITSPNGSKTYLYPEAVDPWTFEPMPPATMYQGGAQTDPVNDTYALDDEGLYRVHIEKWLITNGTAEVTTDHDFRILYGFVDPADIDLGMGDWAWFEMVLGFVGVIGFVATPMVTAKLMSSKDPIVLMSAFMVCMIMFGTFIYVFLLGGS